MTDDQSGDLIEYVEEEEEEEEEDHDGLVRAKWTIDSATSLPEAATMARQFATYLDELHAEGWQLREPVSDDYGFIFHPDGRTFWKTD